MEWFKRFELSVVYPQQTVMGGEVLLIEDWRRNGDSFLTEYHWVQELEVRPTVVL